jgi:hypothetical protein
MIERKGRGGNDEIGIYEFLDSSIDALSWFRNYS